MLSAIKRWFFAPDNQWGRSSAALLCIVSTTVAIWYLYEMPCDTWTELAIDAALILLVIFIQAILWPLLEYIFKYDSWR